MIQHHYAGLTDSQVIQQREKHGDNSLTAPKQTPAFKKFLAKFKDTIIIILLVALLASICVSFYEYFYENTGMSIFLEPLGIFIAVFLATTIGFLFELNADKKFKILNQINEEIPYKVIRNGGITEVLKNDLVVDDIVVLNTGEEIPADGLILESVSLTVNESSLTGEPSASKNADPLLNDKEATYPSNMLLRGSSIIEGHCIMQVQKTGNETEYGKVNIGAQIENNIKTPLNIQLDKLGAIITKMSYLVAFLVIAGRLIIYFTSSSDFDVDTSIRYFLNTLMIAVTIIVVSVPEGLPMSVTLSLALSMKRMLSTNNLVRKMHACETMGAATVICTDKTGTLTKNMMTVSDVVFPSLPSIDASTLADNSEASILITEGVSLNSTAYLDKTDSNKIKVLGNPTEGAMLLWLDSMGIDYLSLRENGDVIEQLPFSTERKYMATLVNSRLLNKKVVFLKGAPETIISFCSDYLSESGVKPLSEIIDNINSRLLGYQNQAMRTLAFACKFVDNDNIIENGKLSESSMTFLGIAAISDPVREEVPQAIKQSLDAGIQVKIVTGDTSATATQIARNVGLWNDKTDNEVNRITGPDFASLSDEEASKRAMQIKIMSRARPSDKERLVRLLQKNNQVVAVTGDGTNDAPALNAAQVGLSMGDGTSVAKQASEITIMDNSFYSINKAVLWGRSLYRNIQKFLYFQLTINVVASVIVFLQSFLGVNVTLTVTQMLWVNLIMDTFAALALASLPPNSIVMKDKPRKSTDHIITSSMRKNIFGVGFLFIVFLVGLNRYFIVEDITSLTQFNLVDYFTDYFDFSKHGEISRYEQSLFFTIFVMIQFWNLFNAKAMGANLSAFSDIKNTLKGFIAVLAIIFAGQILITTFGGTMFNVTPIHFIDWIIIIIFTSMVLWVGEFIRFIKRLKSDK